MHLFSELKGEYGWTKHKFAWKNDLTLEELKAKDNVGRIDVRQISQDEFVEKFDYPKIPVVLTHVQDHWLAKKKWTVEVWGIFSIYSVLYLFVLYHTQKEKYRIC